MTPSTRNSAPIAKSASPEVIKTHFWIDENTKSLRSKREAVGELTTAPSCPIVRTLSSTSIGYLAASCTRIRLRPRRQQVRSCCHPMLFGKYSLHYHPTSGRGELFLRQALLPALATSSDTRVIAEARLGCQRQPSHGHLPPTFLSNGLAPFCRR